MKRKFIMIFAAVCIACGGGLTSCSKSNKALIEEATENYREGMKAMKNGDHEKSMKYMNKANEIIAELNKRDDLTIEEKQELGQIFSKGFVNEINNEE